MRPWTNSPGSASGMAAHSSNVMGRPSWGRAGCSDANDMMVWIVAPCALIGFVSGDEGGQLLLMIGEGRGGLTVRRIPKDAEPGYRLTRLAVVSRAGAIHTRPETNLEN